MNKQSGIQEKETLSLCERFVFRDIEQSEAGQAAEIERICFPPNEACPRKAFGKELPQLPSCF